MFWTTVEVEESRWWSEHLFVTQFLGVLSSVLFQIVFFCQNTCLLKYFSSCLPFYTILQAVMPTYDDVTFMLWIMSLLINAAYGYNPDKLCIIFTFTSLPMFFKNTTPTHPMYKIMLKYCLLLIQCVCIYMLYITYGSGPIGLSPGPKWCSQPTSWSNQANQTPPCACHARQPIVRNSTYMRQPHPAPTRQPMHAQPRPQLCLSTKMCAQKLDSLGHAYT
jgi:hypothetical protein